MVSTLAFSARGHGFDPCDRRGKLWVSEHAFLIVGMTLNKCAVCIERKKNELQISLNLYIYI